MHRKVLLRPSSLIFSLISAISLFSGVTAYAVGLQTSWRSVEAGQPLKTWESNGLKSLRKLTSREKDPSTSQLASWRGVLLEDLMNSSLDGLSGDRRAQVDLIVLRNSTGHESFLPRSLVTKYPLMLASERDKKEMSTLTLVLPWSSKPRIKSENLPLENYFIQDLTSIEFTTYSTRYTPLFLKARTDPLAVRGEKLFVQNCTSCHSGASPSATKQLSITELSNETQARNLASTGHPTVTGMPQLQDHDKRALVSYLNAYRIERQKH